MNRKTGRKMTERPIKTTGADRVTLRQSDDHDVLIDIWRVENPDLQIHLLHGLGEHTARYERFAALCNAANIQIAAHSHRGHGLHLAVDDLGHYADKNGWNKVIADVVAVQDQLVADTPGVPLALIGHSMGSYVAQSFLARGHGHAQAVALSASTLPSRFEVRIGHWLAAFECLRGGAQGKSAILSKMGFGALNKPFEPGRTAFDWLSRDDAEVDKYVADPYCGAESSNRLWYDMTGGLLEFSTKNALKKIPADLPILITGGEEDSVGGLKGMSRLAAAYRDTGHKNVTLKVYPGGRHEMFNETNSDEFTSDLLTWIRNATLTQSE